MFLNDRGSNQSVPTIPLLSGSGRNSPGRLGNGKRGGAKAPALAPILDSTRFQTMHSCNVRRQ
jgi:hypothetical protein